MRASRVTKTAAPTWSVFAVCFTLLVLDGYDTIAMAVAIPSMAAQWQMAPAAFTVALLATNLGVIAGYLSAGTVAARFERRLAIVISLVIFGVFSLTSALVYSLQSVEVLSVTRFCAGIGLGMCMPLTVSTVTDLVSDKRRGAAAIGVNIGLSVGVLVGGSTSGLLIGSFGVESIFVAGGALPLLFIPVVIGILPTLRIAPSSVGTHGRRTRDLLGRDFRATTLLLWTFAFLIFLAQYTMISWGPTLLLEFGLDKTQAPLAASALGFGGIIGGLALMAVTGRVGLTRPISAMGVVAAVAFVLITVFTPPVPITFGLLAVGGGALTAGILGQVAISVLVYPAPLRANGIGCASAWGRFASIVGPAIGGILIARSVPAPTIIGLVAIPVLLSVVAMLAIASRIQEKPNAPISSSPFDGDHSMAGNTVS